MLKDFQYEWLHSSMPEEKFISLFELPEPLLESIYSDVTKYGPHGEQVTGLAERIISNLEGVTFQELDSNPTWVSLEGLWENKSIEMHSVGAFFDTLGKESSPAAFVLGNIWDYRNSVCASISKGMDVPLAFKIKDSVAMLLWFAANDGNQLYPQTERLERLQKASLEAIAVITS